MMLARKIESNVQRDSREIPWSVKEHMKGFLCSHAERALPRRTATFGMKEARTALVAASPPRPAEEQGLTAGWRPEQVRE